MLQQAVRIGVPNAIIALARCYMDGKGVEKNPVEAFKLYCRPEVAQNSVAAFERARCYKDGTGVRKNKQRAQDEYRRAVELRDSKQKKVIPEASISRIPQLKENGLKSPEGSMYTLNLNSPPSQEYKLDSDTLACSESDSPQGAHKQKRGSGPLRLEDYFDRAQDDDGEEGDDVIFFLSNSPQLIVIEYIV